MLRTMSRIKRVCAMILVPRLFRSAGSTPGKFYRLQNEESPILARGFCKTDWTKPKYVTKPYSDVREEAVAAPKYSLEDREVLEKSYSLKYVVLRTLLKNADNIKIDVVKNKYQQLLVYVFGWPRPIKYTDETNSLYESVRLNTTTSKQEEEEKLIQKIEDITEVPLVEAQPRPDIQNPPKTSGPTVMTFRNSENKTQNQMVNDLAKPSISVVSSRKKMKGQCLSAQVDGLGLRRGEKSAARHVHDVVNCKPLDDTENPLQSKFSDDTDRFDTEEPTAQKKSELKSKDSHRKVDTMLIDITLFDSPGLKESQSVLKEAYEISKDSILVGNDKMPNDTKTKASQVYTIYDELPEIKPSDQKVSLTELLRRVRKRNQILHQREMELQFATEPSATIKAPKPGCPPPSPHIGTPMGTPGPLPRFPQNCPIKKRGPVKPEAPSKKDPCAKCASIEDPTAAALLIAPVALPQFLPLLLCSISPIVSFSVSKLSCAIVAIAGVKQRLFGSSELDKETWVRANPKLDAKDVTQ